MAKGSGDDGSSNDSGESKTGIGGGCVMEEFKEVTEIRNLFKGLKDVYKDQIALERSCERVTYIVDQYQEQPHLIDPHLDVIISDLLGLARNPNSQPKVIHEAFRYLYLITKMRGYKVVVRHLPHEVADVEPVLKLLNDQDPYDFGIWETRYMLLLWLSMVCMIPFDMSRLDSNTQTQSGVTKQPIMDRIIEVGKLYIPVADKSRDAAAYMLSHFLTRPDVKAQRLGQVLDWALITLAKADYSQMAGMTCASGILRMLALLFKQGKREDLLPVGPTILTKIEECKLMISSNTVLRKLAVKLVQRLGLIFLKSRVAAWRYQRGSRSLEENLKFPNAALGNMTPQGFGGTEEEEEYDIPDEIEDVIEQLLRGLKDKDTVVRWSAAKGVGRITGRLPQELADDVVGSVLELFTLQESDEAWHGGCLALAELGRRGLLLPQRLRDVVPVVLRALAYDERRGNFSVGAHVRDAACYVCWAFARAYDPKEIALFVTDIANALVIVSIFDREVNVRRAAAAAFQENVGRQGTFPHGIDILTTADYFAVGNRTHCYMDLSVFVANFPEYTTNLIDHLVQVKIAHWDTAMRELSSKALHNLTPAAVTYMAKTVIPALVPQTTGLDLFVRHGAILSVAEIVHALAIIAAKDNRSITSLLDAESIKGLKSIPKTLHEAKLFRGLGGELMRKAVSTLIEKLSASKMPYHKDPVIDFWQEVIDDCLHHIEPDVQEAAVSAIPTFFSEYYRLPGGQVDPVKQEAVIGKYLREIQSNVEVTRKGFSLAVGAFPKFMLMGKLRAVIDGLIQASNTSEKEAKWAESRRDAVRALTNVNRTVDVDPKGSPNHSLCEGNVGVIYEALLHSTKNYTMDSRGDVGAWVREAAMTGLEELTCKLVTSHPNLIQPEISKAVFCCLVQQACEKIDRTRAHAGSIFIKLLHHSPQIPHVPHRKELDKIFSRSSLQYVNWGAPAQTFCLFTQLLAFPTYSYPVLLGLTVSMGGLTESLVKSSSNSTFTFLSTLAKDRPRMTEFTETLLQVFRDYQKIDRVSIPLLKTIDQLLARGCFDIFLADEGNPFSKNVLDHCKKEIFKSGDPQKLMASADVLCGLLPFGEETCKKSMFQLLIFLCHKYPRVRKTTANKLYEAFVTYEEVVPPDSLDEVMTVLSETNWDQGLEIIKPIRNRLCDLLEVPKPVVKSGPRPLIKNPLYTAVDMDESCQLAECWRDWMAVKLFTSLQWE